MSTNNNGLGPVPQSKMKPGQQLIQWISPQINYIKSIEGNLYIAFKTQPHRALSLNGSKSEALNEISLRYLAAFDRFPEKEARSLLESFLLAQCSSQSPTHVYLRVAHVGEIYIDSGDAAMSVIHINKEGFSREISAPVVFARSPITSTIADPFGVTPNLEALYEYLPMERTAISVLIGCLIATHFEDQSQPVLFLHGPAKAGKTTTTRRILDLVDPTTPMPGVSLSNDEKVFKALAKVRRYLVFDNISHIKNDVSDILARTSSGGELITRALYSNDDAHVTQMRRPIVVNGINSSLTRADLASRAFQFVLQGIPQGARKSDSRLQVEWESALPSIMAGFYTLMADVLRDLDANEESTEDIHRNAGVLKVLDSVGKLLGEDLLGYVKKHSTEMEHAVLDGDALGEAFRKWMDCDQAAEMYSPCGPHKSPFEGTYTSDDLIRIFQEHSVEDNHRKLPHDAQALGNGLRRISSSLESALGIQYNRQRTSRQMVYSFSQVKGLELSA